MSRAFKGIAYGKIASARLFDTLTVFSSSAEMHSVQTYNLPVLFIVYWGELYCAHYANLRNFEIVNAISKQYETYVRKSQPAFCATPANVFAQKSIIRLI